MPSTRSSAALLPINKFFFVCCIGAVISSCASIHSQEVDRLYPDIRFSYERQDVGSIRLADQAEAVAKAYCDNDRLDSYTDQIIQHRRCVDAVKGRILETVRRSARATTLGEE